MSALPSRRYSVTLCTTVFRVTEIEARSEAEAKEKAEALWYTVGDTAFDVLDTNLDCIIVD